MSTRKWCAASARRAVVMVLGMMLSLAWSNASRASYGLPYYIQNYENGQLVTYTFDKLDDGIAFAKQYIVVVWPSGTREQCPITVTYADANTIQKNIQASVGYTSSKPGWYTCEARVLDIKLTTYAYDPGKNTGENCNGGNGMPDGDGAITCPGMPQAGDPINVATGNKYEQETDFDTSPWLTFRRFYNSERSISRSNLGPQWRHSFDRSLIQSTTLPNGQGTPYIQLQRPSGSSENFQPTANGGWAPDSNVADTLTADANGYTVYVAGPNQFERYSTSGQLQYIADASGQMTTFTYNGSLLQAVTDPFGRTLQFSYDSNNLLHTVTLPDNGVLTYGYTNGVLTSVQYPDSKTRQYVYNEAALTSGTNLPYAMTGVIDESGKRYDSTGYNTAGQAISSTHAGGANAVRLSGISTMSTTMTSPLGASMRFSTADDGHGRITLSGFSQACHADWCYQPWTSIKYDANGYANSLQDFAGNTTTLTHNAAGLETQRTEGMASIGEQRTINTTWDAVLRRPLTRVTLDSKNNPVKQSAWIYNSSGQVTARCDIDPTNANATSYTCGSSPQAPIGVRQWTYTYCTAIDNVQCPVTGLLLSEDGARVDVSDVTHYSYYLTTDTSGCGTAGSVCHRAGDPYQITDALGHVVTYASYDGAGRVTRVIDPNGVTTDLTYTPRGWIQTRKVGSATTTYAYTPYGSVASVTDADGVVVTYGYDDAHRLIDITDAQGNRIHYTLDAAGNETDESIYAAGSNTPSRHLSRTFNNLGQLTKIIDGLNQTVFDASASGAYNLNGNLANSIDVLGVQRTRRFDTLNRLQTIQDSAKVNGSTQYSSTTYAYDALDHVNKVTTPDYKSTASTYDGLGNPQSLNSPDTGVTSSTFDAAGNVLTRTDAKGNVATFTYDAINRTTATTYVDPTLNVSYRYDEADSVTGCTGSYPIGRPTRIIETSVTTVYCYDARGNVTQKSQIQGASTDITGYTYTSANRLASVRTPSGASIQYQRDVNGRVSAITALAPGTISASAGNVATSITYLPFGPIASYTLGNGQTITRSYDVNYQVTDVVSPALNLHFARDAMGRIVALGNAPGASPAVETYSYDWLSRLAAVTDATGTNLESYTYDAIGNRASKTANGLATGTYGYYQYPHNWLTNVGSTARTYDNNGNTTGSAMGGETFGFGYNSRNRMTVVQRNGSTVGTYTYNAQGQRTAKSISFPAPLNQRFAYDEQSQLIGEYGDTTRDYVWLGNLPLAVIDTQGTASTTSFVHADGLSTPRAITDANGTSLWKWDQQGNPFGEQMPLAPTGYVFNLRFSGQYYDAESSIFYNGFRNYDPATGRYLQSDPIGLNGGISSYAYVQNSPAMGTDPQGLQTIPRDAYFTDWTNPETRAAARGFWANMIPGYALAGCVNNGCTGWGWGLSAAGVLPGIGMVSGVAREARAVRAMCQASGAARGVANPISSTLARVVPRNINPTTLGRAGDVDVFVTNASELRGLSNAEIASKLTIPEVPGGFRVIEFPSSSVDGIASPVFRSNPGFLQGGQTANGAAEFVIPNGPIPPGATQWLPH
ncbi:RHS repeat-associated core domain-containing protein [Dyella sp. OK004]|uniref:polymorphic toxin type 10 domain-containing protein n=1 Tax=Dyella sp. OK004 TaxID=1855292 RepID=UPI0008E609BB|nr:polymorphic toxin type 10 domain-containing protein [Dyella sp. OK004]SFS08517.1 RHS repeat-associated core domain-containing protein [Dyella sp. OK004]